LTRGYAAAAEGRGYAAAAGDGDGAASDPGAHACRLSLADIAAHAESLLAGVPLAAITAAGMRDAGGLRDASEAVLQWREVFDDRLVALAEVVGALQRENVDLPARTCSG
jgi:hypothetical protein